MYSKMPTKRKISIFFGFGWPSSARIVLICIIIHVDIESLLNLHVLEFDPFIFNFRGNPRFIRVTPLRVSVWIATLTSGAVLCSNLFILIYFIYQQYLKRVNTFSLTTILPCGPL